jgi:hypothetical protein
MVAIALVNLRIETCGIMRYGVQGKDNNILYHEKITFL